MLEVTTTREELLANVEKTKEKLMQEEGFKDSDHSQWGCLACKVALTASLGGVIFALFEGFRRFGYWLPRLIADIALVIGISIEQTRDYLEKAEERLDLAVNSFCAAMNICDHKDS